MILVRSNRGLGLRYLRDGGRAGRGGSSVLLERPLAGAVGPLLGFLRSRNRRKLTFFRLLLQDRRVPLYVKLLPLAVVVYVASPIDLLPGLIFDDVAVALLTLVLIVRVTPVMCWRNYCVRRTAVG